LQVHICKFADLQVSKFTKLKNLENCKLIITIYNFINCKCVFASSQVCKFTKSQNYKLIITNLQFNNCKSPFANLCKFTSLQIYKVTNCKCAFATMTNHHITKLPNMKL